jgi:Leucine-rich repeat (LRR) protein
LEKLENLSYLELAHNKLTNIDNLSDLNNLLTLKIEFNQITNINKILNNKDSKLEMFTMKFNQIDEKIVNAIEENNQKVYKLRNPNTSE